MALAPKTATIFLVDCSASMNEPRTFVVNGQKGQQTGLDVAKQYIKAKVVQRIMRDLKTTPFAVICYGHEKTKNILTMRAKQAAMDNDEKFDRKNDSYRHCYDFLPLTFTFDKTLLERINEMEAGYPGSPPADSLSALILGIETIDVHNNLAKYHEKSIVLITDGESEVNWDGLKGVQKQLNIKNMSVTVVGMDFDDEEIGYIQEDKSKFKQINEQHFHQLVDGLDQPSVVANGRRAITAITTPQPKLTNSVPTRMPLTLGDPETRPDASLSIWVELKKAVMPASAPSMKKMSLRGFEKARTQAAAAAASQSQSQSQAFRGSKRPATEPAEGDEDEKEQLAKEALQRQLRFEEKQNRERQAQKLAGEDIEMRKVGLDFDKVLREEGLRESTAENADIASHDVMTERRFFYRPPDKPKNVEEAKAAKKKSTGDDDEEVEESVRAQQEEEEEEQRWREAIEVDLSEAYHYGGSLVPIGDLDDGAGTLAGLQTGMEIVSFMKESDIRFEWRMGDVYYVYATIGQVGSEKIFSALINGMNEKKSVAVVRLVKKGSTRNGKHKMPDPQLGILFPKITEEGSVEFCYWIRLPFAEDIRSFPFPSLDRLFNRKGVRIVEHKNLPTEEMELAMDDFVESMDLMTAGDPDEDGEPTEWFSTEDSYSPAIHNIANTLVFRMTNPDGDLPAVPRVLTKYMDPPASVVESSHSAREKLVSLLDVKLVPPKPKALNKKTAHYDQADKNPLSLNEIFNSIATNPDQSTTSGFPTASTLVNPDSTKMDVDETRKRFEPSPPTAKVEGDDEDGEFVIVDKADGTLMGGGLEEDDDEEPDTEEDEPTTKEEDEAASSAPSMHSPVNLIHEAENAVVDSFSFQNYSKAVGLLQQASEVAVRTKTTATYNNALRSFTERIRAQSKKREFLVRMQKAGVSLAGVPEEETKQFSKDLA